MSTSAVTTDSAPEREPASLLMPTDKKYRITGELPEELEVAGTQVADKEEHATAGVKEEPAKETPESVETEGDSAPPKSETAADSEPARQSQRKTQETSESRWAKLSRENRELRERLARVEESRTEPQRETKQAPQPAAQEAEPQIDAVNADGSPKYKTVADYLAAVRKYDRDQILRETDERWTKAQREQQQRQFDQVIEQRVHQRVEEARKTHTDYDETMEGLLSTKDDQGRDAFFYTKGSPIDGFFLDSDKSHDVMYELAKNFDQHKHIFARDEQGNYLMNPIRQLRELAKIEASLDKPVTPPAKPVTKAPPPPHQLSGKGAVNKDAVEKAVEDNDVSAYMREQNARELARRKKG